MYVKDTRLANKQEGMIHEEENQQNETDLELTQVC